MGRVPSLGTGFTGDPRPCALGPGECYDNRGNYTLELNQKSLKHQKIQRVGIKESARWI